MDTPQDQVFWYLPDHTIEQLRGDATADVVIIGGGMAGLSAAQAFHEKGCSVILLEKSFCGAGASGKSSGFITPDCEFSLGGFVDRFGPDTAKLLWEFVRGGVTTIKRTIEERHLSCDYIPQDTLVLASSDKDFQNELLPEYEKRMKLGYNTVLHRQSTSIVGSELYYGGVSYGDTFGMNGYQYLQGLKRFLQAQGVRVYEETPALGLHTQRVVTPHGAVRAGLVVLCMDRFTPELGALESEVYHVQTFLMASEQLTNAQCAQIFPEKPYMVWDTDLLYQYFRLTKDRRLLLGGATLLETYAKGPHHESLRMYKKLTTYWATKFPQVIPHFRYMWPGLIGVSKDIMPLAGRDEHDPTRYYVAAAAGLPWAAALGGYAADALIDGRSDLDQFMSPSRPVTFGPWTQRILGTRLTFALSHLTTLKSF
jgi:gamma-glutamylputrescine oxidase